MNQILHIPRFFHNIFTQTKKRFNQHLLDAIRLKDNKKAKSKIEKSNLHRKVDFEGRTLLHYAALYSNSEITRYLVDKGCDVNIQDSQGCIALMEAVKNCPDHPVEEGLRQVIIILLESGSDVFIVNKENKNSINLIFDKKWYLWCYDDLDVLRKKLQQCINIDEVARGILDAGIAVTQAIVLKDPRIIEYMLKHGDPNQLKPVTLPIAFKVLEITKLFIKYGGDVNEVTPFINRAPINYLYNSMVFEDLNDPIQIDFLKALLDAGVSTMSLYQRNGVCGCMWIFKNGHREAIRLLLQSSLDFTALDTPGRNVLHYLALNTNPGIAEELENDVSNNKLNIDVLDVQGFSPVHISAFFSNVDFLMFLLKKGADVNLCDDQIQFTPLFLAYMSTAPEHLSDKCIEILLQHNADPQFVRRIDNRSSTIFESRVIENDSKRNKSLKPVIARLAWLEKSGTPIIEKIKSQINAEPTFKNYFEQCQRLLSMKIADALTVFKLLNANEKQMAKSLKNRKLAMKLIQLSFKLNLKTSYSYYYNILEDGISRAFVYKTLTDKAAVVVSQLLKYRLDDYHVFIHKIIEYLNEEDLWCLYEM